jgi:hypothetical protein
VKHFPYVRFHIEGQDVPEILGFVGHIASVDYHLTANDESAVRIDLGNVYVRRDTKPVLGIKAVDVSVIVTEIGLELAAKQDQLLFVSNSRVSLQTYLPPPANIVQLPPNVLLAILRKIHFVEISNQTLLNVVTPVNVDGTSEHNSHMV